MKCQCGLASFGDQARNRMPKFGNVFRLRASAESQRQAQAIRINRMRVHWHVVAGSVVIQQSAGAGRTELDISRHQRAAKSGNLKVPAPEIEHRQTRFGYEKRVNLIDSGEKWTLSRERGGAGRFRSSSGGRFGEAPEPRWGVDAWARQLPLGVRGTGSSCLRWGRQSKKGALSGSGRCASQNRSD